MIKRNKYILAYSIVFWIGVIVGVILFSVSFQKVPIEMYGLRANYFSPTIDPAYYTPGLYDTGIGFYFILFPSVKQYIVDSKVTVINLNL